MGSILARKNYWLPSSRFDVDGWRRIRTLEGTTRRALRPRNNRFSRADIKVECLRSVDVLLGPCLFYTLLVETLRFPPFFLFFLSFFFLSFHGSLVTTRWRATNAVTFVSDRFKIRGKLWRKEIFLRRQRALWFYKYFYKINESNDTFLDWSVFLAID